MMHDKTLQLDKETGGYKYTNYLQTTMKETNDRTGAETGPNPWQMQ